MKRHYVGKLIPAMAMGFAIALAGCDSAEPLGTELQAADAGVLHQRAGRADEMANDPVLRTGLIGNAVTGAAGTIRGLSAPGRTWVIDSRSEARITARGELRIDVRGLVFAGPPGAGTNPLPAFRGAVSCLTVEDDAVVEAAPVITAQFPASPAGDARIRETLDLPDPCLAPVLFVTSPAGTAWFAVSGV